MPHLILQKHIKIGVPLSITVDLLSFKDACISFIKASITQLILLTEEGERWEESAQHKD